LKQEECGLSVLSAEKVRCLSLGVSVLDDVFQGFELGDFVVLRGRTGSFISFVLAVRCQLPPSKGGLRSSVVFVDGGNSFNPYLVAETARSHGLDSRAALKKIYVSRAFTAYQLSSLISQRLESFLKKKRAKLLVVSDIASLFSDRDIPKTEAKDLFMKTCTKLSEIASRKKSVVLVTHFAERLKRNMIFDAVLYGKANVSVRFRKRKGILSFILEDHSHVKSFTMDLPASDYASLKAFMKV
jgi:hypothetical protein